MIRKLKENKAMAAVVSVLILAAADSIQQRFSVSSNDNIARTRRSETWRKAVDLEQAFTVLSNKVYMLENPQKKPKR